MVSPTTVIQFFSDFPSAPDVFPLEAVPEDEAADELEDATELASGPVKKKLPATGSPRPTSEAKRDILKLLMAVDELTNAGAT